MRNYLDSYMRSLARGEQVLARNFIWSDRRFLAKESDALTGAPLARVPRFPVATPMQLVSRYMYAEVFDSTKRFLDALYTQANNAAHIRTSLNEQVDKKLERIESALQKLEQEVDDWEDLLCTAPEAVHTINRDFGTGLRPVVETPTELELISLIIESNVPTVTAGGYISVAIEDDRINEPMFSTLEGLQLRYIYTFAPGLVDKIHLEPITGIGEITMVELRVYGSQGNLISTITEDEKLSRTLDYSIPKTMVSRIEIDIIDRTYVIEEITTTTTVVVDTKIEGETRTVIPGKKEKVLVGYDYEKLSDKTEASSYKVKDNTMYTKPANPTDAQTTAYDILTGKYGYSEEKAWDLAARLYGTDHPADYVYNAKIGKQAGIPTAVGGQMGTAIWDPATGDPMPFYADAYKDVEQGMRASTWASGFMVRNPDGTYTSYSWKSKPSYTVKTPGTEETNKLVPIYDYVNLPDDILIEPFSSQTKTSTSSCSVRKRYHYEGGLRDLVCSNSFYTELLQQTEVICFEGGIPTYLTMTTDEHLPHGAHINFWMVGNNGELINVLPEGREFTTDVLRFDQYGKAMLKFYPEKELYYYKDEEQTVSFPTNGRYVMGPSNNLGAINTLGGSCFWARYQPNHSRANYIPYTARVASYVSPEGILGETFENIPESSKLTLRENPYVDTLRLDDSTYSPIQVVIDGYNTMDLTNYYNFQEEEFPVEPRYLDTERMITYKTRGKTIFFEEPVDRPVRIFYEYVRDCVKFVIEMGVTNQKAACPVLYSYSLSYV